MATVIFVAEERCRGCGACVDACPRGALYLENGKAHVLAAQCAGCELCIEACPESAIYAVREPVVPTSAEKQALRSTSKEQALQTRPAWLATLGAVTLVAERLLPVLVNVATALKTQRSEVAVGQKTSASASGERSGLGFGRYRRRYRRGSRR